MLIDELKALVANADNIGCAVQKWVNEQDAEIAELMSQIRQKPGVNVSKAYALLLANITDLPFKRTLFGMHMRGDCGCPKA